MFKKLLLAALLLAPVSAMAQKFGHYDGGIVETLPEYKKAMTELEELGKGYQAELEEMQKELQTRYEKFQKEMKPTTPQNVVQRKQKELEDLQMRLQQASEDNSKAFQEAQQQKMQPILVKVQDAVAAVAKEGGYLFVLDKRQSNAQFYINETISEDVTSKLKAKLGL